MFKLSSVQLFIVSFKDLINTAGKGDFDSNAFFALFDPKVLTTVMMAMREVAVWWVDLACKHKLRNITSHMNSWTFINKQTKLQKEHFTKQTRSSANWSFKDPMVIPFFNTACHTFMWALNEDQHDKATARSDTLCHANSQLLKP